MSTPHEQDEAFVALPDLALGTLTAGDAVKMMSIVQTSERLQRELASLRGAVAALGYAAPKAQVPFDERRLLRERLISRAAADVNARLRDDAEATAVRLATPIVNQVVQVRRRTTEVQAVVSAAPLSPRQNRALPVSSILLGVATVGMALFAWFTSTTAAKERGASVAERARLDSTIAAMSAERETRERLLAALTGPTVRVMELQSTSQRERSAKVFWDTVAGRWTLVTNDLAPADSGRTYQLWLVTARAEKISAGTFQTDRSGRAVFQPADALAGRELAAIEITDEPFGGAPQPSGAVLIAGVAPH
jgi:anti-sigma-K factor RskA